MFNFYKKLMAADVLSLMCVCELIAVCPVFCLVTNDLITTSVTLIRVVGA